MIKMTPNDLVLNARKAAKIGKWDVADQLYKRAIAILAKKQSISPNFKEFYLSTIAEYLCNKPYLHGRESLDEFMTGQFDAIRYLNECSRTNKKKAEYYRGLMHKLVQQIIKQYGCVLFETEHHVVVNCPIRLSFNRSGLTGTSMGVTYKNILCSICGLDMLDENCTHDINHTYDGKRCAPVYKDLQIKDISLVSRPKDPLCVFTEKIIPREELKNDIGNSKINLKQKLDVRCTLCRDEGIDSSSITPEFFFKIHGLNIALDKPKKISAPKNWKKGGRYFSSIVYTEGGDMELCPS